MSLPDRVGRFLKVIYNLVAPEAKLRAKMVPLAISSVASDYRLYLIQTVLGLVSYLESFKLKVKEKSKFRTTSRASVGGDKRQCPGLQCSLQLPT